MQMEDSRLRPRQCVSVREKGETQEWPMTPSGRIPSAHASWPLLRAKKKARGDREPHGELATHESRYHADYLREIFNPSALPARAILITHISFYALKTM